MCYVKLKPTQSKSLLKRHPTAHPINFSTLVSESAFHRKNAKKNKILEERLPLRNSCAECKINNCLRRDTSFHHQLKTK